MDLLELDPNDSGEIRLPTGQETEELGRYMGREWPPLLRRSDAATSYHGADRAKDYMSGSPAAEWFGGLPLPTPSDTGHLPIMVDVADRQAHARPKRYVGLHRDPAGLRAVRPGRVALFARQVAAVIRGAW